MPNYHLPAIDDLKPEQKVVFDTATLNRPAEFILVQGVAGSGKTTIALNILRQIANDAQTESAADRRTAVLITYNETLVADCKKKLKSNLGDSNMLWDGSDIERGHINIITYRQFCELLIDDIEQFLKDEKCIKIIDNIRSARGPESLLSSQIFTLITTFLKGRPDLVEDENRNYRIRTLPELKEYLDRQSSPIYRIYKPLLLEVKGKILDEYQQRLERKKDRAQLSYDLYKELRKIEDWMKNLKDCEASKLRDPKSTGQVLCDRSKSEELKLLFSWLREFFPNLLDERQVNEELKCKIKELDAMLNSKSINNNQLEELKSLVPELITKYGMRGTPIFDKIGNKLKNPVIIVDEVQDLGKMECEIIISLWFQLQKVMNRSKLILFGDLNQQMTPTGFHWEMDVKPAIAERSELYEYDEDRFNPNWPFTKDVSDSTTPFRKLDINYRTSWHIAALAHNLMSQLIPANIGIEEKDSHLQRYYEDAIIDPNKTFPEKVLHEIINRLDSPKLQHELQPKIMILEQNIFFERLKNYLEDEKERACAYFKRQEYEAFLDKYANAREILQNIVEENDEEVNIEIGRITDEQMIQLGDEPLQELLKHRIQKTLVIITKHNAEVEQLKKEMNIGTLLTDYAILACKGLEFMGCVVWGLPTGESRARIELDLIGQWYTSLTRAKVSLLICLTNEEFEFLRNAGWRNYQDTSCQANGQAWWEHELSEFGPRNIFEEIRNPSIEQVVEYLREVAKTELGPEESKRAGENAFSRFRRKKDEFFLQEALSYFRWGGWINEEENAQAEAARIFEKDNNFLLAAKYYRAVSDFVGEVRCYVRESVRDSTIASDLVSKSREIARELERDSKYADAARCWYWLKEWESAIDFAIEETTDEICSNIVDIVYGLVEKGKYVYKIKFDEIDIQSVELGTGNGEDARRITEVLEKKERYKEAGQCWSKLEEWINSVDCFIKAFEGALNNSRLFALIDTEQFQKEVSYLLSFLKSAEEVSEECTDSDIKKKCWENLAEGYYITLPYRLSQSQKNKILQHFWPRAFYLRYVTNMPKQPPQHRSNFPQSCLEVDGECKKQKLYLVATKCWIQVATSVNFKITKKSLEGLKSEGVSVEVLKKLQGLKDQEVTGEEEFLGVLRPTITNKKIVKFDSLKSLIFKYASMDSTREIALQEAEAVAHSQQNETHYETAIECWNECWKIEKSRVIANQIAQCWIAINKPDKAFEIAKELSQQFSQEVEAIKIMYFTCRLQSLSFEYGKDKCEDFIEEEFWKKGQEKVAIECWKYIINHHESSGESQKAHNGRKKAKKVILETTDFVNKWDIVFDSLNKLYEDYSYKEQVIHEARKILEQLAERGDQKANKILEQWERKIPPTIPPPTKPRPKLGELLIELLHNVELSDFQDKTIVIKLIQRIIDESDIELAKVDWENVKVRIRPISDHNIPELIKRIDIILG